jgi:hypothetical protein
MISLASARLDGIRTHALRVSNDKAAAPAAGKNRRRLRNSPAIRTPAFEMSH